MNSYRYAARLGLLLGTSTLLIAAAPGSAPSMSAADAAAAFGKREQIIDASISPDGSKVAFVVPGPAQSTVVEVIDLKTGDGNPVNSADGNPFAISTCGWASNTRIVCRENGVASIDGRRLLGYSRLAAMNADGSDPIALGTKERGQYIAQQSDGYVLDWRDGSTNKVLLAREYIPTEGNIITVGSKKMGLGVDLIDTSNGAVDHVESPDPYAEYYLADGKGVRIMATDESLRQNIFSRGVTTYRYRLSGSEDWKPFSTYSSVNEQGMLPIAIDGSTNSAYVVQKKEGRKALYRVALDGSMKSDLAYANPNVDISGVIQVGREGRVVGATYSTDKEQSVYFDPKYEQLTDSLAKALPATPLISIIDSSADLSKHLIYASSDVHPGSYYFFDATAKRLTPLAGDRPQLGGVPLGSVQSVTYAAADGTQIPGYLTMPPGGEGKNIPAIVMPHGGPASRDEWGFDWLVQFFVNRGYAVLQPEYRGSTGYGDEWFNDNGFHSWKTAIGDVNDAGHWLVKQGIADPSKLAIVGWSYGGYAALQSNVLDPDLFKAVVAVAPVTDLGLLRGQQKGFISQKVAQNEIGDDAAMLEAGSPARHAAAFKAPVLMFQGTHDINVDAEEARYMDKQLKKAGKSSELIVYPNIDHQLRDSAVRTDLLSKADAFLRKSLKL